MILSFSAQDTFVFKEARPLDSFGGNRPESVFPPPARTLHGALRTLLGDLHGVDWQAKDWPAWLGSADTLGDIALKGPFLFDEELNDFLFPVPRMLVKSAAESKSLLRLKPSPQPVMTDLGRVHLPAADVPVKSLEDKYITGKDLAAVLTGKLPSNENLVSLMAEDNPLLAEEPRFGIQLQNETRTVTEGMLYQLVHLRPKKSLKIIIDISTPADVKMPSSGLLTLGGRTRLAGYRQISDKDIIPKGNLSQQNWFLVFLTDADFGGHWYPEHFTASEKDGSMVWAGELHGVQLEIISVAAPKPKREGGYDLQQNRSRPVQSLVPAGTVWYLRSQQPPETVLTALHGRQIGRDTALGRGLVVLGSFT